VRSADGLSRLLGNPHPLVRAIARCALARDESRGAHQRSDHPERNPALDGRHVVVRGGFGPGDEARLGDETTAWQAWS
jgi:L-aspartate oxidase